MTEDSDIAPRRLARSQDGRLITGVCAGLARYTRIDAVVFRVGFALLVITTGIGILLYIGAFLLMAAPGGDPSKIEQFSRRLLDGDTVLALLGAALGAGMLLGVAGSWGSGDGLAVVVVFALVLFVARSRGVDLTQVARTLPERVKGRPLSSWAPPRPAEPPAGVTEGMIDLARLGMRTEPSGTGSSAIGSPGIGSPGTMPYGTAPYGTAPYGTAPYGTGPYRTAPYRTAPYRTGPYGTAPYGTAPYETGPYGTAPGAAGLDPGQADTYGAASRGPWSASAPPPCPPRRGSFLTAFTLTAAMLVGGLLYASTGDRPGFGRVQITLAGALAVTAAGLFLGAWLGRDRKLITAGALMSLALASTSIAGNPAVAGRTHRAAWRPAAAGVAARSHKVFIGEGVIDLTQVPLAPGERLRVTAEVTLGVLDVKVPSTARVEVDGQAFLGDITVDRRVTSGPRARVRQVLEPEGRAGGIAPTIALRIRSKVGDMAVTRVPA